MQLGLGKCYSFYPYIFFLSWTGTHGHRSKIIGLVSTLLGTNPTPNSHPAKHTQFSHDTGRDISLLPIPQTNSLALGDRIASSMGHRSEDKPRAGINNLSEKKRHNPWQHVSVEKIFMLFFKDHLCNFKTNRKANKISFSPKCHGDAPFLRPGEQSSNTKRTQ